MQLGAGVARSAPRPRVRRRAPRWCRDAKGKAPKSRRGPRPGGFPRCGRRDNRENSRRNGRKRPRADHTTSARRRALVFPVRVVRDEHRPARPQLGERVLDGLAPEAPAVGVLGRRHHGSSELGHLLFEARQPRRRERARPPSRHDAPERARQRRAAAQRRRERGKGQERQGAGAGRRPGCRRGLPPIRPHLEIGCALLRCALAQTSFARRLPARSAAVEFASLQSRRRRQCVLRLPRPHNASSRVPKCPNGSWSTVRDNLKWKLDEVNLTCQQEDGGRAGRT